MNIKVTIGAGALALVPLMAGAPTAQANTDTPVTIIDDQHYLNDADKVTQEIKAKEFPSGMQVAVLLRDDSSFSQDGYDAEVKRYAMAHLPAALVNKKANDLNPKVMLITISPEIHKMGLYGGKETGINSTWVDSAVETMRPYAQSSDWDGMAIQGAGVISEQATVSASSNSSFLPGESTTYSDDSANVTGGMDSGDQVNAKDNSWVSQLNGARNTAINFSLFLLALILSLGVARVLLRGGNRSSVASKPNIDRTSFSTEDRHQTNAPTPGYTTNNSMQGAERRRRDEEQRGSSADPYIAAGLLYAANSARSRRSRSSDSSSSSNSSFFGGGGFGGGSSSSGSDSGSSGGFDGGSGGW